MPPTRPLIPGLIDYALSPMARLKVVGRLVRSGGEAVGTAPGTVVHTGERRVEEARIRAIRYDPEGVEETEWADVPEDPRVPAPAEGVLWVNVDGLHDVELLERLGGLMGFHALALEDVADVAQRPKFEEFDEHFFLVLHMLGLDGDSGRIVSEQVSLVVGPGYLFSFQEAPGDVFEPVRDRIRAVKGRIRRRGSDYLAYALVDAIVDSYFEILEGLGERTEELEDAAVAGAPSSATMQEVHELKRELLALRRSVWPLREMVGAFLRAEGGLVEESTKLYLRDVLDHCYRLMDGVDVLRDLTTGIRDLHLANVSHRTNEVMKVLTVMASIFIPLTFVAGVYGMNFEYMPELEFRWSYPVILVLMLILSLGMLRIFRRKGWI